ncbi:NADPH:quinone reductase [Pichia kluyveri]|uniref:Probable quinone oxidoreductase n=1 Tax=Pichia kluyveri TaxID=36015 RepID=A0AAV5R2U9_PICKL|nr:NADPH:quinone reductase [Pichia kluyveri]
MFLFKRPLISALFRRKIQYPKSLNIKPLITFQINKMSTTVTIPEKQSVIYYDKTGGPEVLQFSTDFPVPSDLASNEILVKNRYSGINYIETYFRNGIYPASFPYIPGREASGEIVAIGSDVKNFKIGDKIAYLGNQNFAQFTKLDSNKVSIINVGANATDDQLKLYAASLLQGLTAITLINEAYNVKEGDYILVTAAAGGVGLILVQLLSKIKKAHVIAVASTNEKLNKAKVNGAEFLLNSSELSYDQIADKILEITNGKGADGIFDSIGKDSFEMDMKSIKRKGTIVSFGNASGAVSPLSITRLSPKNVKIARPQLFGYVTEPEEFQFYTESLFDLIKNGDLKIDIYKVYALKDYKTATIEMEGRKTSGKILLEIPN